MDASLYGFMPGETQNADPESAYPLTGQAGAASGTGVGQHGIAPVTSNGMGGSAMGAVQTVWRWLNTPFQTPMAPTTVFALVGVILVAVILWNMILYHVRIAAETI